MAHRYIVTGGGGFVGKALSEELRRHGHHVISIARGEYPELRELGIESHRVDISADPASWWELFKGCDGVFHTAAKVDMWGRYEGFFRTNVLGTRNIIEACNRAGVRSLVFTSSPSVIHDGKDLRGVDETYPYPEHCEAFYPKTKAEAEKQVRAADTPGGLRTVALRPHLIWGPNDTHLIPTIVDRARAGRLIRIGDGTNLVDLTFIDDCVQAHLCAMRTLQNDPNRAGGKAYFISQGEPVRMWDWIGDILRAEGIAPINRTLSTSVALRLAGVMEGCARLLLVLGIEMKPLLTRFLVSEMATSHYFSIESAKRDLGYRPAFTIAEAFRETFQRAA